MKDYNNLYSQVRFSSFQEYCAWYRIVIVTQKKLNEIKEQATVIKSVGNYLTRNNKIVEITEIKNNNADYNCHGYLKQKGKQDKWVTYDIYGLNKALSITPIDLLTKV